MSKPIKASEVELTTDKTPQELRRERARAAVARNEAKREGLKRAGADIPPSRDDLAARLEYGLKKREAGIMKAARRTDIQAAVQAKLDSKGAGK